MQHTADIEFANPDDQEPVLGLLRPFIEGTSDATLTEEEGEPPRLHIEADDFEVAQLRADEIMVGAINGTDFKTDDIKAHMGGWPH